MDRSVRVFAHIAVGRQVHFQRIKVILRFYAEHRFPHRRIDILANRRGQPRVVCRANFNGSAILCRKRRITIPAIHRRQSKVGPESFCLIEVCDPVCDFLDSGMIADRIHHLSPDIPEGNLARLRAQWNVQSAKSAYALSTTRSNRFSTQSCSIPRTIKTMEVPLLPSGQASSRRIGWMTC